MSEAKVLTTKQQRKTLSNAKKKKKAPLRNVYGNPRKQNWPVLNGKDESSVLDHLRNLLGATSDLTKKPDQSTSKVAPSSKKHMVKQSPNESIRNQVVLGLREVTVEIRKGNLKGLLLAEEVDPPSLGFLVGNLAEAHNIPYAAISNLKGCLEELLGFKSWCVGFKISSKDFDLICDILKSATQDPGEVRSQQKSVVIVEGAEQSSSTPTLGKRVKVFPNLHLHRTDRSQRIFVPGSALSQDKSDSSFISFSKDRTSDTVHQEMILSKSGPEPATVSKPTPGKSSQNLRYFDKVQLLPLRVKRFQENPNKQKWKKSNNRSLESSQPST